jgi:hypothetical protein
MPAEIHDYDFDVDGKLNTADEASESRAVQIQLFF